MKFKTNQPKIKGRIAEEIVRYHLIKLELVVLVPIGDNERYDFVVHKDNRFIRIQSKLGRIRKGALVFSTRSVGINRSGIKYRDYLNDVDYFAVLEPESEQVYLIPVSECPTSGRGVFRLEPAKNGMKKTIKMAKNFLLADSLMVKAENS